MKPKRSQTKRVTLRRVADRQAAHLMGEARQVLDERFELIRRLQDALGTEERDDALVTVALHAHQAERELAKLKRNGDQEVEAAVTMLAELPTTTETPGVHRDRLFDAVITAARAWCREAAGEARYPTDPTPEEDEAFAELTARAAAAGRVS